MFWFLILNFFVVVVVAVVTGGLWYRACVCVCFTAQSQLPRGETALRVFAQQVGPHQEANSRFWPASSPGLELRAQHANFTNQYWERSVEPGGGVQLAVKTSSVTASRTALPPTSLPPLFLCPASCFIPSYFSDLWFHWLHYCLHSWWPPPPSFAFFMVFCFFSISSCGISNHWTSGRGCLHVWRGLGKKKLFLTLKDFIFRQKKNKKKYFRASQNINNI